MQWRNTTGAETLDCQRWTSLLLAAKGVGLHTEGEVWYIYRAYCLILMPLYNLWSSQDVLYDFKPPFLELEVEVIQCYYVVYSVVYKNIDVALWAIVHRGNRLRPKYWYDAMGDNTTLVKLLVIYFLLHYFTLVSHITLNGMKIVDYSILKNSRQCTRVTRAPRSSAQAQP